MKDAPLLAMHFGFAPGELPEQFLNSYELERVLGAGGMGVVVQARQLSTGRTVAVKFMRDTADSEAIARFRREGRLLVRMDHPNVLRIYDADQAGDHLYIVSEVLAGGSLRELLARNIRLTVPVALEVITQVLDGLAACHAAGVIHRDLKPDNVMFRTANEPVIVDLGLGACSSEVTRLTRTGVLTGTLRYMAPEQWIAAPIGPSADVYAAGIMLYELLAGQVPFQGSSLPEYIEMHCHQVPPRLDVVAKVSRSLADFVALTLEKDPGARPQDGGAMRAALIQAASDTDKKRVGPRKKAKKHGAGSSGDPVRGGEPVRGGAPAPGAEFGPTIRVRRPGRFITTRSSVATLYLFVAGLTSWLAYQAPRILAPPRTASAVAIATAAPAATLPWPSRPPPGLEKDSGALPNGALYRIGSTLMRSASPTVCALSSSGEMMATADIEDRITIFDARTRRRLHRFSVNGAVEGLAFIRGDTALAVLCVGPPAHHGRVAVPARPLPDAVTLFAVADGKQLARFGIGEASERASLAGSHAVWIAPKSTSGPRARLVDLETGALRDVPVPAAVGSLAVNALGDHLLVSESYSSSLLSIPSGRLLASFRAPPISRTMFRSGARVALSPDGAVAAFATKDGLELTATRAPHDRQTVLTGAFGGITFAPDGELAAWSVLDTDSTAPRTVTLGRGNSALNLRLRLCSGRPAFSADGQYFGVASLDGRGRVIARTTASGFDDHILQRVALISPCARRLLVVRRAAFALTDLSLTAAPVTVTSAPIDIGSGRFSPDGNAVALQGHAETGRMRISLHDGRTGALRGSWFDQDTRAVFASVDGTRVAATTRKGLRVYGPGGAVLREQPDLEIFSGLFLDPTFTWVATAGLAGDTACRLEDIPGPRSSAVIQNALARYRRVLAFSADGRRLVSDPSKGQPLAVAAVPSFQRLATMTEAPAAFARCAAFSTDGTRLAVAFDTGEIRCWDPGTGTLRERFQANDEAPIDLALDPVHDRMLTLDSDGTALAWQLSAGRVSQNTAPEKP